MTERSWWQIAKDIRAYWQQAQRAVNQVANAVEAVGTDLEAKHKYIERMVNHLAASVDRIDELNNRAVAAHEAQDEEALKSAIVGLVQCFIDVHNYEGSLRNLTDFSIFEKYREDLIRHQGSEYRYAYHFYNLFQTLLNQTQPCLKAIATHVDGNGLDLEFFADMLRRIADAYNEFYDEHAKLIESLN